MTMQPRVARLMTAAGPAILLGVVGTGPGCVRSSRGSAEEANPFVRPDEEDQGGSTDAGDAPDAPEDSAFDIPQTAEEALVIEDGVDHVKGSLDAPNQIIEYGSFVCPHCARFFDETLPEIDKLVDEGRVTYVYRYIAPSDDARTAVAAAECAAAQDESAFYPYHDLLFENFLELDLGALRQHAVDLGLDLDVFDACLADNNAADRIFRDGRSAQLLGVDATPAFLVNGELLVGEQPISAFEALLIE